MDGGEYLRGVIALGIAVGPWIAASHRLARRCLPDWSAAEVALAGSLIGVTALIVIAELLGLVGAFRRWPFAVASALVAAVVGRRAGRVPRTRRTGLRLPRERSAQLMLGCVAVCVLATTASLVGRDAAVLRTGPLDVDSIHYHLTQAADMVQTHSDLHLHHTASSDPTVYYPYDAELLDAIAMLGPHPDLAVFPLNLLFGWLALLACWVIGARWSLGAPVLAAGAAIIALPIVSQASTAPGLNDLPAIAFVLSAVAALATAGVRRLGRPATRWLPELGVAGLGLGLAAGTKLNALPIAFLIAVAAVAAAAGDRRRAALALALPAFVAGGFWYVRDWVTVGSPVPDINLTVAGHGFHVVPYPEVKPYAYTAAHYLGDPAVIRHWMLPELRTAWTGLWPILLAVLIAGIVIPVLGERAVFRRLLGVAVAVAVAIYLATPTTALGSAGRPLLFGTNTRYLMPVLALAAVLFAVSRVLRRFATITTVGFTAMLIATLALENLPQSVEYGVGLLSAVVLAAAIGVGGYVARRGGSSTGARALVATGAIVLTVAVGALVQHSYLHHRYRGASPEERLFALVGSFEHQRIGVTGHGLEYPFFGPDYANTVNYVGVSAPSRAFDLPTTCPALMAALARLHDDIVVVEPLAVEHTDRVLRWMTAIPGIEMTFSNAAGTVFELPRAIPPRSCTAR